MDRRGAVALGVDRRGAPALGVDRRVVIALGVDRRGAVARSVDRRGAVALGVDRRGAVALGVDRRGAPALGVDRRVVIALGVDLSLCGQEITNAFLNLDVLVGPYLMLGKLLAVSHNHVGEVSVLGAPPKIILDNGNHLSDALRLVEPLILLDAGAILLPKGQKIGLDLFVIRIHRCRY